MKREDTIIKPAEPPPADLRVRQELERRETAEKAALHQSSDAAQRLREDQGMGLVQSLMVTDAAQAPPVDPPAPTEEWPAGAPEAGAAPEDSWVDMEPSAGPTRGSWDDPPIEDAAPAVSGQS